MSITELTCANGSREEKTQGWFVTDGESFDVGYNLGHVVTLDSSKGRYEFAVYHPPGSGAGVGCVLVWRTDRWELEAKTEDFVLGTPPGVRPKLSCTY